MPRQSRRRFLLKTGASLTAGWMVHASPAEEFDRHRLAGAAEEGRRFLTGLFDPDLDLLPEFLGSQVYWLYHDNYLAAKVLDRSEPDLARRIRETIRSHGIEGSGKIEILFGEATQPLPFRHYHLKEVKRLGSKVIKTEIVGDKLHEDWREYTDLLFIAAIAKADTDRDEAMRCFEAGLVTWDGTGFRDRVNRRGGLYATYKLALALIAAARIGRKFPIRDKLLARLLRLQRRDGGFVTDYDVQGRPVGEANVETTSLTILALGSW
jgi:hypothetical protein